MIINGKIASEPSCPHCHKKIDGFCNLNGDELPSPGDVTVCAYCVEIIQFTVAMSLVPVTEETLKEINLVELQTAQRLIRDMKEQGLWKG